VNLKGHLLLVSLGLAAGLLTYVFALGTFLAGGIAGLPHDFKNPNVWGVWYSEWSDIENNWDYTVATVFVPTALLFVAGGLLGHALKPKRFADRKPGWAYRILNKLTRRGREPNRILVKIVSQLPTLVVTFLGLALKVLANRLSA
jgi:hypothetical protein